MEDNILSLINYVSLDNCIIAFLIFGLTMLIKTPIKNATKNLNETKRKAINSIIIIIPITLSIILNATYFRIFYKTWFSFEVAKSIINSWVISLSVYAIYERAKIIFKAFINGELNKEIIENNKTIIANEISDLVSTIESYQRSLKQIEFKMKKLNDLKREKNCNLTTLFEANIRLKSLNEEEKNIKKQLEELTTKLQIMKKEEI